MWQKLTTGILFMNNRSGYLYIFSSNELYILSFSSDKFIENLFSLEKLSCWKLKWEFQFFAIKSSSWKRIFSCCFFLGLTQVWSGKEGSKFHEEISLYLELGATRLSRWAGMKVSPMLTQAKTSIFILIFFSLLFLETTLCSMLSTTKTSPFRQALARAKPFVFKSVW